MVIEHGFTRRFIVIPILLLIPGGPNFFLAIGGFMHNLLAGVIFLNQGIITFCSIPCRLDTT